MNFLDIARTTRLLSGIQGTGPSSVTGLSGIEEVLVRFVQDAYTDIQNVREDWEWMEASQSFSTQVGKDTYTLLDIFLTSTPGLKKYQLDSFIITNSSGKKSYMKYADRGELEARYLNSTDQGQPSFFTIDPSTHSVILKPISSGLYSISFRYQKSPEVLSTETQVPLLPLEFHNLIVYKAVEKMAVYLSSPEIYRNYSVESLRLMGQLMRLKIPKMRMRAGAFV